MEYEITGKVIDVRSKMDTDNRQKYLVEVLEEGKFPKNFQLFTYDPTLIKSIQPGANASFWGFVNGYKYLTYVNKDGITVPFKVPKFVSTFTITKVELVNPSLSSAPTPAVAASAAAAQSVDDLSAEDVI